MNKRSKKKPYKPGATIRKPLPNRSGGPMGGKKGKKGYNRKKLKKIIFYIDNDI